MSHASLMLAAFVHPWIFWLGGAAVSVPVVIHLLAKRRFKRVRWAAIDFLLLAEKHNRRKVNIKELILLALRCLAILLIGLLLARPVADPGALADVAGKAAPIQRVFVLDDSFSMGHAAGATSTFDRARSQVLAVIDDLVQRPGQNQLTIFRSSDLVHALLANQALDETCAQNARQLLGGLAPTQRAADFRHVLGEIREQLHSDPEARDTVLYVVSDFQRYNWVPGGSAAQSRSPLDALADWPQDKRLSVVLIQAADRQRHNLAVTDFTSHQPQLIMGIDSRLRVTISNYGSAASPEMDLQLFAEDAALPAVAVPAVPAGESREVSFLVTFPEEGFQGLRAEIAPDALPVDNQRVAGFDVQAAIKVLLINGEPGSGHLNDEVGFLKTALRPQGQVYSGFSLTELDASVIETADFNAHHIVVLANVHRVDDQTVQRLEEFAAAGGGVAIFLGDQIDTQLYDQRLWRGGDGLLPCELGQPIRIPAGQEPPTLTGEGLGHPIMKVYGADDALLVSGLMFWTYVDCVLPETPAEAADSRSARVIARYTDAEQRPAIVERAFGQGNVILFTTSCDQEWNNWPVSPGYVVSMLEMGHDLARPRHRVGPLVVGSPIEMSFPADRYNAEVTIQTPRYPAEPLRTTRAASTPDGTQFRIRWPHTNSAGIYRLQPAGDASADDAVLVAVNPEPAESNLAAASELQLRQAADDVAFDYVNDVATLQGQTHERRREYWPAVLVAVITLLMLEQSLACWFGKS